MPTTGETGVSRCRAKYWSQTGCVDTPSLWCLQLERMEVSASVVGGAITLWIILLDPECRLLEGLVLVGLVITTGVRPGVGASGLLCQQLAGE